MWTVLAVAATVYALLAGSAYLNQAQLVYFPEVGREVAATPRQAGLDFEDVVLVTEDGLRIAAWWVPAPGAKGTVLFAHGNAGNISHRIDFLKMFRQLGYSTLIFDYRGYGRSEGTPDEDGTYRDIEAAWRHLTGEQGIPAADIVLYGESLGGAVAAWLAARHRPRALVLASTFTSLPDLGAEIYPLLPVRWLARYRYDTRAALAQVRCPVLVIHSPGDDIIPYRHGRALFDAAPEPKAFLAIEGGHNYGFVFMRDAWIAQLGEFLDDARRSGVSRNREEQS